MKFKIRILAQTVTLTTNQLTNFRLTLQSVVQYTEVMCKVNEGCLKFLSLNFLNSLNKLNLNITILLAMKHYEILTSYWSSNNKWKYLASHDFLVCFPSQSFCDSHCKTAMFFDLVILFYPCAPCYVHRLKGKNFRTPVKCSKEM